jgi:hypothetical protein
VGAEPVGRLGEAVLELVAMSVDLQKLNKTNDIKNTLIGSQSTIPLRFSRRPHRVSSYSNSWGPTAALESAVLVL